MEEENSFNDPTVARQWIDIIEGEKEGSSRYKTIYPFLKKFVTKYGIKNALEIGSGQGICSISIPETVQYLGIEPSDVLLKRSKELYESPVKHFTKGNAYNLPCKDNDFDFVFSVGVLFHLENLQQAAKEMARVLKPNGRFVIFTANPNLLNVWKSFFNNPVVEGKKIVGSINVWEKLMAENIIYMHTKSEIVASLEDVGLLVTDLETFGGTDEYDDEGLWVRIEGTNTKLDIE